MPNLSASPKGASNEDGAVQRRFSRPLNQKTEDSIVFSLRDCHDSEMLTTY
jgi:hypothetical protein